MSIKLIDSLKCWTKYTLRYRLVTEGSTRQNINK
uniref:Uncharacterized protein n=1 Tax=Arundo donax TaxID=35708 RepID=A0A0A9GQE7_ARUDO